MRTSFSYGRGRKIYRYYVSDCLLPHGRVGNVGNHKGQRISAQWVEKFIATALTSVLPEAISPDALYQTIQRVIAHGTVLKLHWDA